MQTKVLSTILLLICCNISAQTLSLKTEYVGSSSFTGRGSEAIGNSKGDALITQGIFTMPLSVKTNALKQPIIWSAGLGAAYVSLNNRDLDTYEFLSSMLNMQFAINHVRPLNNKWTMAASVGFGVLMPNTNFSNITFNNIMGNLDLIFIAKLNNNLDIGAGVAINNTFGYPMIFPSLYFNWQYIRKIMIKVSSGDGAALQVSYALKPNIILSMVSEMNGYGAFLRKNNKNLIFTHQNMELGFRGEFIVNKNLLIPLTIGGVIRSVSYSERKLKAMFVSSDKFKLAPYISAGLKIKL